MSWIWQCMLPFLVSVSVNLFCIPSLLSQTTWWRCTVLLLGNTWGPGLTFWVCFLGKSHNLPMNHSSSLLSYSGNWLVVTPNILWKVLLLSDCSHSISSVLLRLKNKTHTHTHTHPHTQKCLFQLSFHQSFSSWSSIYHQMSHTGQQCGMFSEAAAMRGTTPSSMRLLRNPSIASMPVEGVFLVPNTIHSPTLENCL
jgi:hypothetical protein